MLVPDQPNAFGLAVDDANLFWVNSGDEGHAFTVLRAPKQGGAPTVLVTGFESCFDPDVALDDGTVYWSDSYTLAPQGTRIMKVPKQGGSSVMLATAESGGTGARVAADTERVYWADSSVPGTLSSMPKGDGPVTSLATGLDLVSTIALDSTAVYVAVFGLYTTGSIVRIPKQGGPPTVLAEDPQFPGGVAVDEGCVYWTNEVGQVLKAPK